jgi:hypothetical protein
LLLRATCVANQSAFIRADVLRACGDLNVDYHYAMDHDLWLRLALMTQFAYLPGVRGAFRIQPAGKIQNNYLLNRLEVVESLVRLADHPLFPPEYLPALHQGVAQYALQAMKLAILSGRADIAERSMVQALAYDPELERFTDLCTKLVEGLVTAAKTSAPAPPPIGGTLPRAAVSALRRSGGGRPEQIQRLEAIAALYQAFAARGRSRRVALAHVRRAMEADPWWLALDEVVQLALTAAGCRWAAGAVQRSYRHVRRLRQARMGTSRRAPGPPEPVGQSAAKAPVAFLIYNRPEVTRAVFARIRQYAPPILFVVADGPRSPQDARLCDQTREILDGVDWPCDVRTNLAETNMGLAARVSSGLDWVFGQCEAAIVLEDDCVPDPSFFGYCNELLERYRDDPRVGMICGFNLDVRSTSTAASYRFGRSVLVWGWATWSRAWQDYDHAMTLWPELQASGWLHEVHADREYARLIGTLIDGAYRGYSDSWSYRWMLSLWLNEYLTILPNTNLVTNIGFGDAATHTKARRDYRAQIRAHRIALPLVHPAEVAADRDADRRIARRHMEEEHQLYRGTAGLVRRAGHACRRLARELGDGIAAGRA